MEQLAIEHQQQRRPSLFRLHNICLLLLIVAAWHIMTNVLLPQRSNGKIAATTTKTRTKKDVSNNSTMQKDGQQSPTALVHVGPHKTGTTAIQSSLRENAEFFFKNKIYLPAISRNSSHDLYGWSRCIKNEQQKNSLCHQYSYNKEIELIQQARKQSNHIIISSEALDDKDVNHTQLLEVLKGYGQVYIIVVYRRFHSQVISSFGQRYKSAGGETWAGVARLEEKRLLNINQYLSKMFELDYIRFAPTHATNVVDSYKNYFANISVINMHDYSTSMVEGFYCHEAVQRILPDACLKERESLLKPPAKINQARSGMEYDAIAIAAYRKGLLFTYNNRTIARIYTKQAIKNYTEHTLGLNASDLPKTCVSTEIVNRLEKLSIKYEGKLLPYLNHKSFVSKGAIHKDIELAKTTKFCSVNTTAVLRDQKWITFLKNLRP